MLVRIDKNCLNHKALTISPGMGGELAIAVVKWYNYRMCLIIGAYRSEAKRWRQCVDRKLLSTSEQPVCSADASSATDYGIICVSVSFMQLTMAAARLVIQPQCYVISMGQRSSLADVVVCVRCRYMNSASQCPSVWLSLYILTDYW